MSCDTNLFTKILDIFHTVFSFCPCKFTQGWVFILEDKKTELDIFFAILHYFELALSLGLQKALPCQDMLWTSPCSSVSVSAISFCFVSSSLMLWIRGARSETLVLLPLSSPSVQPSSVPSTAFKHSRYSNSIFFRYPCRDLFANSSSTDNNLATIIDKPVCRVRALWFFKYSWNSSIRLLTFSPFLNWVFQSMQA